MTRKIMEKGTVPVAGDSVAYTSRFFDGQKVPGLTGITGGKPYRVNAVRELRGNLMLTIVNDLGEEREYDSRLFD